MLQIVNKIHVKCACCGGIFALLSASLLKYFTLPQEGVHTVNGKIKGVHSANGTNGNKATGCILY